MANHPRSRYPRRKCRIRPRTLLDVTIFGLMLYAGTVPLLLRSTRNQGTYIQNELSDQWGTTTEDASAGSLVRGSLQDLSMSQTPALVGAKRGLIECDVNVDSLAYWNDPQGTRDREFQTPFGSNDPNENMKYLTFELDRGGWNNIRMSLENIIVFAAATGRTLVLPPDQPLYLLRNDPNRVQRGPDDFIDIHTHAFNARVPVITAAEFIQQEGGINGRLPVPHAMRYGVMRAQTTCQHRNISDTSCFRLHEYYTQVGLVPLVHGEHHCLVFDEEYLNGGSINRKTVDRVEKFCAEREPVYYDAEMREATLIHFRTSEKKYRILVHFYAFIFFTDPIIDNFFKRFIRDHVRYKDEIFCAAGRIVNALQDEGKARGFVLDREGGGGFSSLHVRRGDFQWEKAKLSGEEWYLNTKDHWLKKEILYITTDEHNSSFFDPIAAHHDIRFLDDFKDVAGLSKIDPNFFGMIEAIVASRGRIFVGTYPSSFSAYIGRMRGYHGMSGKTMWYAETQHMTKTHEWVYPEAIYSYREFPIGWTGIDGDEVVTGFKP